MQATIKTYREGLAQMCVQLEQASIDAIGQDSHQVTGNLSQSPSVRSTPIGFFNVSRDPPQHPPRGQAQERPARDGSGGRCGLWHGQDNVNGLEGQERPGRNDLGGLCRLGRGRDRREGQGYNCDTDGDRGFRGGARGGGGDRGGGGPHDYYPHNRSPTPTDAVLDFKRQNIIFLLGLISDEALPEVMYDTTLDVDTIKELNDVRVPEVQRIIRECRDVTGKYAARPGCDHVLIHCSQLQCEHPYEWARQVVARYRSEQHHLSGNAPTREATFTAFDPEGEISVHEFFMRY